jgi:hypothetical protein
VVGDEAIRETLARALRVRVCRDETATRGCIDPVARIFAVGSRQHRIEVGSAEEGAESFSLLVTSSGVREEADVSLGPAPSLSLPALVAFVPPRPPGTLVRPGDPGLAVMRYEPGKEPALVGASRVDLGALRGSR